MNHCPHCQSELTGTPFCGGCGRPVDGSQSNNAQASQGGVAVAGPNARIKVKNSGNSWDTRPQTQFERTDNAAVSGWLGVIAALITLAAAVVTVLAATTDIAGPNWIVTALISAAVAGIAGFVAVHVATARFSGHSVVRVGGWLLGLLVRDENGRILWTRPVADCMYCPPARKSIMTLQWRDNAAQFVCTTNRKQHIAGLDWTQI